VIASLIRRASVALVLTVAAVALLSAVQRPSSQRPSYAPVTDQRLLDPEAENWLMYRRTYDGAGYSPLTAVTRDNVADLAPVWSFSTGVTDGHESPPIVNNGVMFVTTPRAQVFALDAASGDLLWRYVRPLPEELVPFHPTNRGVSLYEDKVYVATVDGHLLALDAATGTVVWDREIGDYKLGYYATMAPLIVKGKVMVGVSGGEFGIRGFVQAFDARSGQPVWKAYTIPGPGEPGNETWPGDSWKTGGAPAWVTGTYDPALNLTYWGTGNPGPWMGDARPGDNLYANSVIALDADTGQLRGFHQYHWNDSWDWDEVSAPILIDVARGGRTIKALVHAGRNGYLWLLERTPTRIGFVDAWPFVAQNVFTSVDKTTGRPVYDPERKPATGKRALFCPSLSGGKNWPPAAYSPQTGYLYIPANENLCTTMQGAAVQYEAGKRFMGVGGSQLSVREGADHIGELQAWDLATAKKVWTQTFESQNWGPILTTGGGLVFMGGTNDRYFRAFDARTGARLWQQRTNSGVIGVPTSYAVNGVQYVAVQSGWGVDAQRMQLGIDVSRKRTTHVPQGGVVWVFALRSAAARR
jgi:alcohol dehydrogenase (cytochrome c)